LTQELAVARRALSLPRIESAFAYVEQSEEETVREWLSLCNAYGPQGDEIYRSRLIYKLFRIYGLEKVHIDDALNVIGVRPGTGGGRTVVLNAHHDNLALWPKDQPVEAFVADGRVWCPAAGDDLIGVTQLLTVLRGMNAADIRTRGDVWFVTFTGEEHDSRGARQFVQSHYPHNIDWRRGDVVIQLHGGGGEGVATGSTPIRHRTQLRVFVPLDWNRWRTDAVDALGPIIQRVNDELRDPRSLSVDPFRPRPGEMTEDLLYLNMAMVRGNVVHNATSDQASIRFDLRSPSEARLWQAHQDIQQIAAEECSKLGEGCGYLYELFDKKGTDKPIEGWDKLNNAGARMVAAAAQALYGTTPVIDSASGCGDCVRGYEGGMPGMSFRGNVVDYGGGRFEVRRRRGGPQSAVRRKSSGHDVTESAEIVRVWSGIKHALLFLAAYSGLAN
jgi:acetylornithine deacetylase/succinyl-diaminopimelate desuccinylase-like protein